MLGDMFDGGDNSKHACGVTWLAAYMVAFVKVFFAYYDLCVWFWDRFLSLRKEHKLPFTFRWSRNILTYVRWTNGENNITET
jgi:hypothetical protein